ncbi:MAG: hypothetical protein M3119_10835, partial [Verrucomicrobiota bacterium]|nr:hypothetical protein [Verrucomicrobiota bacterium]
MKKFLITSLVALPIALNLFAQTTPPPAAGTSPAISASAPATTMPAATAPVTMSPATAPLSTAPGLAATPPGTVPVVPPPPGMS